MRQWAVRCGDIAYRAAHMLPSKFLLFRFSTISRGKGKIRANDREVISLETYMKTVKTKT